MNVLWVKILYKFLFDDLRQFLIQYIKHLKKQKITIFITLDKTILFLNYTYKFCTRDQNIFKNYIVHETKTKKFADEYNQIPTCIKYQT